jgi:hypothetical protein
MVSSTSTCGGPIQSGKRFELGANASEPISRAFDTAANPEVDRGAELYWIFGKFTSNADGNLSGLKVELGSDLTKAAVLIR